MRRYRAYPEYRNSGVEWFGTVPKHWTIEPLKRAVAKIESGTSVNASSEPAVNGNPGVLKTSCVYSGQFNPAENKAVVEEEFDRVSCPLKIGALIVSRMNTPDLVGAAGLVKKAPANLFLPDRLWQVILSKTLPEFAHYWTHTSSYRVQVRLACSGTSSSMQNLSQDQFGMFLLPQLPIEEQRAIVAFLDHETAKIDRLIAKQEELITLLKEKRQAVISHAIFKAPTGKVAKLGHYINLLPGYAFSSEAYTHDESDIRLLRGINVSPSGIRWDDVAYWPISQYDEYSEYQLVEGDIVFGMDRPWISEGSRVCIVSQRDTPSLLLQRVARIRPLHDIRHTYLYFILGSNEFRSYIEADLTGVSVPHISADQIASFRCAIPSLEGQDRTCSLVKHQLDRIESLTCKASEALQLLRERRTALISAAVTGKIDVRDWKPERETHAS